MNAARGELSREGFARASGRLLPVLVVALCAFTWAFRFPFVLTRVSPPYVGEGAILLVWGLAVLCAIYSRRALDRPKLGNYGRVFLVGYGVYLTTLTLATLLNLSLSSFYYLAAILLEVAFLAFLVLVLKRNLVERLLDVYSNAMVVAAVLAMALSFVIAFYPISPAGVLILETLDGRQTYYQNYLVGFIRSPLQVQCLTYWRIQSLSDEAGSFAFALLPALFWLVLVRRSVWRGATLLVAVLLTLSVGAWGSLLIVSLELGLLWRRRLLTMVRERWRAIVLCGAVFAGIAILAYGAVRAECAPDASAAPAVSAAPGTQATTQADPQARGDQPGDKGVTDYSGERIESINVRSEQLRAAWVLLLDNPAGVGAGQAPIMIRSSISVGFMNPIPEAGVLGGVGYLAAISALVALGARATLRRSDPALAAVGASVVVLFLMALQRIQMDGTFWHMFLIAALAVLYGSREGKASRRARASDDSVGRSFGADVSEGETRPPG